MLLAGLFRRRGSPLEIAELAVYLVAAGLGVGGAFLFERQRWHRRRDRAMRALAAERGLSFIVNSLGAPEVSGEVSGLPVQLVPASLPLRGRERGWRLAVSRLKLARRTTLTVSLESDLDRLARSVGLRDIEVGRKHFDDHFRISGSAPDVIRGVLEENRVRAALVELFFGPEVARCELWEGALFVDVKHDARAEEPLGRILDRVLTLARALEDAADAEPVPEKRETDEAPPRPPAPSGSLGGGSGAPVGVPVFEER